MAHAADVSLGQPLSGLLSATVRADHDPPRTFKPTASAAAMLELPPLPHVHGVLRHGLDFRFVISGRNDCVADQKAEWCTTAGEMRLPWKRSVRHAERSSTKRARSTRSISYGLMHLTPTPMHALGILIFLIDGAATSCVTTVWPYASACATR